MSRETAPNYRQNNTCYYCQHMQSGRKDGDVCTKHEFFLYEKEMLNCVCDDYVPWRIPFKISDSPPDYKTDIEPIMLRKPRLKDDRAEYVSELTVEKQIKNFDDIFTATRAKGAEAWGVAPEDLTSANNENLADHLGHIARAKENTMQLITIFQAIQKKKEEGL